MSKQIQRLIKEYPNLKQHVFFTIDDNVLVLKKDLPFFVGGESRAIEKYEKDGLQRSEYSLSRLPLYDPIYSTIWKSENKQQKFRPNRDKNTIPKSKTTESSDLSQFLESLPAYKRDIFNFSELDTMDKLAKLRDIEKKEIDNSVKLGELIDRNDTDKREAGLVGMLMASQVNYEKAAPSELVGKDESEILSLIRSAHYDVTDELDRLFNKHFDVVEGFYDVMAVALKAISNGLTPVELIEKIEENE